MSDEELASTTAQAGLTVVTNLSLSPNTTGGTGGDLTLTDPVGFGNFATAADINLRNFSASGVIDTTVDAGANSGGTAALDIVTTLTTPLTFTFNTPWPSSSNVGLGAGVMDFCTTPASGPCTPGSATDYAVMMAPSSGVKFALNPGAGGISLNMQLGNTPQGSMGLITDTAPFTFTVSGTGSGVNLALVDPGNFVTTGTTVGGVGLNALTISGLDFGSGASGTTLSVCTSIATATCTVAKTNPGGSTANPGLLLSFGASAMTGVNVVESGLTIGNVGGGTTGNRVGLAEITNLNLANTSVLVSGH